MSPSTNTALRRLFTLLLVLASIFAVYKIALAVYALRTTGELQVNASDKNATLTVRQPGYKSVNIGVGSAKVRLKPGNYEVVASKERQQAIISIKLASQQKLVQELDLSTPPEQTEALRKIESANTFVKLLPYTGPSSAYRITYKYDYGSTTAQPTIVIAAPTDQTQKQAVSWIRNLGFNPSDFKIEYIKTSIK